ncbi:MAG: response regulator transcription factor [Coriobacteriia bacterium]|nr:response regulator transcription factor [Coriobacteriia bacterium]
MASKRIQRSLFALAMALDTMFYLLVVSLPFVVALIICTLAPICSALFFLYSFDSSSKAGSVLKQERVTVTASQRGTALAREQGTHLAMLLLCCLSLSFAQGVFRTGFPAASARLPWTLIISSAVLTIVGVAAVDLFLLQRLPSKTLPRLFFPVVVIACLAMPFFVSQDASIAHFFTFAGCFLLMVYLYSEVDAANPGRHLPTQVFALGIIASNIGCILGIVFGNMAGSTSTTAVVGLLYAAVCLALCLCRELRKSSVESERFLPVAKSGEKYNIFRIPAEPGMTMIDSISRQCHGAAIQYALSTREEEVLRYLVRGKSAKSIASSTYISYNTTKTHMSHIYQKLGIHTREAMIQLVESITINE